MQNNSNRLMAGLLLLAMFSVIALAGSRVVAKAQGTQNVLVTNTSSQQVPVLPAARPGPGGAYVVAVANAPTVKVASSATAPLVTKDSNNPDVNGAIYHTSFIMAAGSYSVPTPPTTLSSTMTTVVDSVSVSGASVVAGECIDDGALNVYGPADALLGVFSFIIPLEPSNNSNSAYSGAFHVSVPAGGQIQVGSTRTLASGTCGVVVSVSYHTVPQP